MSGRYIRSGKGPFHEKRETHRRKPASQATSYPVFLSINKAAAPQRSSWCVREAERPCAAARGFMVPMRVPRILTISALLLLSVAAAQAGDKTLRLNLPKRNKPTPVQQYNRDGVNAIE